jgi:hypothetical protein
VQGILRFKNLSFIVKDHLTKSKLGDAALGQSQVYDAAELIIVCSNTSRSVDRYGNIRILYRSCKWDQ